MGVDWGRLLVGQLEFYWEVHLRPRLEGLTDEEYFWEPVEGCWSLRRAADGSYRLDLELPEPVPPPVTTIAWRLVHVGATCFFTRASTFFGDAHVPEDADMFDPRHLPADLPGDATQAVTFLERSTDAGTTGSPAWTTRAWPGRSDPGEARMPGTPWPS